MIESMKKGRILFFALALLSSNLSYAQQVSALDAAREANVKNPGGVERREKSSPGHEHEHVEQNFEHDQNLASRLASPENTHTVFSHRHSREWHHPRYNYYHHEYHLYPYVYVSPTVYVASPSEPVTAQGSSYYYDQGTFYENKGQQYSPTPPPIGTVVASVPEGCSQIVIQNQAYCLYNGIYYKAVSGGYQVVAPPA
jgi:hypothetical protein